MTLMTVHRRTRSFCHCFLGAMMFTIVACAPSSLVDVEPTNNVADPAVVATEVGATQLYNLAVTRWADVVAGNFNPDPNEPINYVTLTAVFSDELMRVQGANNRLDGLDERLGGNGLGIVQDEAVGVHTLRVQSSQAREALLAYAPHTPPAWRARLQAEEAYAIVYLAEFYCSGVPLSTVPLVSGSPTKTRGFTTQEMLEHSVALFDSAITLAGDSTRFRYLAAVGKGRALLDLGRFTDAAAAVANVPTDFVYLLEVGATSLSFNPIGKRPQAFQVRDHEGGNGLVWSSDPRTAIVTTPSLSAAMLVPGKYAVTGGTIDATITHPNTPVRAADGVEARLIEAEADLANHGSAWLTTLNMLRSTCIGTAACAPVPGLTGANLPDTLTDPGSDATRLDLLMQERAMWLYLTGHRQGDLRRMAHVYHRDPQTLWPMGTYLNPGAPPLIQPTASNGTVQYATQFVADPGSTDEKAANPLYTGCYDQNP